MSGSSELAERSPGYRSQILALSRELQTYEDIFAENGSPRDPGVLRWRFGSGPVPVEKSVTCILRTNDEAAQPAALYAAMAVPFVVNGRSLIGCQSLDTLTDSRHRRKGLFVQSARDAYRYLVDQDVALVYGFPNALVNPGRVDKLGWRNMDPVPFLIRPFPLNIIRKKLGGSARAKNSLKSVVSKPAANYAFADEYDALWQEFRAQIGVGMDRHGAYMDWRLSKPGTDYRIVEERSGGKLKAVVVFCVAQKHGRRMGYVMECVHGRQGAAAAARCMKAALREMREQGCDLALAWCMRHSPNYAAYSRNFFLPLPERFRPIKLHFGAHAFESSPDRDIYDRKRWYLSYLDSDTV